MVPDYLTIAEAAKLIQQRELSPVELVDGRLARIEKLDSRIHSFIRVLADSARAEARAAESEITAGKYRGPLHGIPIGLKDIYETAGIATTGHSKVMQDHVPKADAFSVRKLRDAGAVVMGKLATHEFALGGPSFDLPWPPARNPWDTARFTGGSSSGPGLSRRAKGRCQRPAHRPRSPFPRARQRSQCRDPQRDRCRGETARGTRLFGARRCAVAASGMVGLRHDDHAVRGVFDPRSEPAPPLHRFRREFPRPHGVGRPRQRRRLCAGVAPPPRARRRIRPGDAECGYPDDRRRAERGAADRSGAEIRVVRAAEP